jgi:acyl-coenzyme A thioesterase 9
MIFGGFLLKQTFELAFCCAASFSHARPSFVSLDPSTFQNPVPVGSVLYLTATVTYTDPPAVGHGARPSSGNNHGAGKRNDAEADEWASSSGGTRIQVRVDSKVRNVEHGETKPTGTFNYTFWVNRDVLVMPRTYGEFMMYVDARRRATRVAGSLAQRETSGIQSVTE